MTVLGTVSAMEYHTSKPPENGRDPSSKKTKHFRPKFAKKGKHWFSRWVTQLVRENEISWPEAGALLSVIDETEGWPVYNRKWVRLTRSDWAHMLGMTERRACDVRDRLLEKGYLRRRKASEAPEAIEPQERSGYHYAVLEPGALEWMPEIKDACDPEK